MTTHIQKIQALGNKIVNNLNTMGVSASFDDGALTLADKILQIANFTTTLDITPQSQKEITVGQDISINGKLSCSFDDGHITISNKPLKNCTIKLYNDSTLLKTTTTDDLGEYNFTTPINIGGDINLQTKFERNTIYKTSQSNIDKINAKYETIIYLGISLIHVDQVFLIKEIFVTLKNAYNNEPIPDELVYVSIDYETEEQPGTKTYDKITDNDGEVYINLPNRTENYYSLKKITIEYNGNDIYKSCTNVTPIVEPIILRSPTSILPTGA